MNNHIKYLKNNPDKLIKFLEKCNNKVTNINFNDNNIEVQVICDANIYNELGHLDSMFKVLSASKHNWVNPYGSRVRTLTIYNDSKVVSDYPNHIKQQSIIDVENLMEAFFCKVCPNFKEELKQKIEKKYNDTINTANELEL